MKHHSPITIHHILPSSFGWHSRPNNLIHLKENVHRAVHTIFQDDTPIMRLRRMIETDKRVLNPEVYLAISNTIKQFEWIVEPQVYEKDCIDYDKFVTRYHRYD